MNGYYKYICTFVYRIVGNVIRNRMSTKKINIINYSPPPPPRRNNIRYKGPFKIFLFHSAHARNTSGFHTYTRGDNKLMVVGGGGRKGSYIIFRDACRSGHHLRCVSGDKKITEQTGLLVFVPGSVVNRVWKTQVIACTRVIRRVFDMTLCARGVAHNKAENRAHRFPVKFSGENRKRISLSVVRCTTTGESKRPVGVNGFRIIVRMEK